MPSLIAVAVDAEVWVRLVRAIQLLDPPQAVFDDQRWQRGLLSLIPRTCDRLRVAKTSSP